MANLIILNVSGADLFMTGVRGTDLSDTTPNQKVPQGVPTKVATFDPSSVASSWDWMNIGTQPDEKLYQIYIERKPAQHNHYFSIGFYDKSSTEEDSNPSPLPVGISAATQLDSGDFLYVLWALPRR